MPYIKKKNNPFLNEIAKNVLESIPGDDEIQIGEHAAFFCSQLVSKFLGHDCEYDDNKFQNIFFDAVASKTINDAVDEAIKEISKSSDLLVQAESLDYILSSVVWGIIGPKGTYSLRVFVKGCLLHIVDDELSGPDFRGQVFRRYLMLKGVLSDVIEETCNQVDCSSDEDLWPLIEREGLTPNDVGITPQERSYNNKWRL